jgi:opacity protein-like surface antigen
MFKTIKLITLLSVITLSFNILAKESLNYNFFEVGYADTELDDLDPSLTGYYINGSYLLSDSWFVGAGYSFGSLDVSGNDVDADEFSLLLGYRFQFSASTDIYVKTGIESRDFEVDGVNVGDRSENGYLLGTGIRSMLTKAVEIDASVEYGYYADSGSTPMLHLAAQYHITDTFGIGLRYSFIEDGNSAAVFGRVYF